MKTVSGTSDGIEDLNAQDIEARAEAALDRVISFFSSHGIEIKARPKVKYLDQNCPLNSRAAGVANLDISSLKRLLGITGVTLLQSMYRYFNLNVSDAASHEALAIVEAELSAFLSQTSLFQDGEDIDLFFPIRNMLDRIDAVMAHEVWHLHEESAGLTVVEPLIREATATYVENLIDGRSSLNPVVKDHFDVIYKLGAAIVEQELAGQPKPLLALLDPNIRTRIEARFQREAMPLFQQYASQSFNPRVSHTVQKNLLTTDPAYQAFRDNPSAENMLLGLTKKGYHKLAADLASQDLNQLLTYSRNLLE